MATDLEQAQRDFIAPWDQVYDKANDYVIYEDRYPVSPGHLLFVPKYNTPFCIAKSFDAAYNHGEQLLADKVCSGYNVGFNRGPAAGQTVMYPHVHLIPRYTGDCEDPTGGVRNVIPGKGNYKRDCT